MSIQEILNYLHRHEIDYRLESNHCCGYIFYFLDGSIYPRRYYDAALEGDEENIICESVDHQIERALGVELKKDWKLRIEALTIEQLFKEVETHLKHE